MFITLQPPHKEAIRQRLLECLQNEGLPHVRHKIGDAVAEIARQYSDEGECDRSSLQTWRLIQCFQSKAGGSFCTHYSSQASRKIQVNVNRLFAYSQRRQPSSRSNTKTALFLHLQKASKTAISWYPLLQARHFRSQLTIVQVRIAALEAFSSFFSSLQKKSQKKYYPLVPELLEVLPPLKNAGDAEGLTKAFIALIELAEEAPVMFKPWFSTLVQFSITVIQDKELGDTVRQNALELMGTFADYSPAMCKRDSSFTVDMVIQCLSLMTDVGFEDDDASDWNNTDDVSVFGAPLCISN